MKPSTQNSSTPSTQVNNIANSATTTTESTGEKRISNMIKGLHGKTNVLIMAQQNDISNIKEQINLLQRAPDVSLTPAKRPRTCFRCGKRYPQTRRFTIQEIQTKPEASGKKTSFGGRQQSNIYHRTKREHYFYSWKN